MNSIGHPRKLKSALVIMGGAFIALSGPALAQESAVGPVSSITDADRAPGIDLGARLPEGYMAQAVPAMRPAGHAQADAREGLSFPGGDRILPPEMDPVTAEEIRKMDGEGLLARRKKVSEDILLIERDIDRAAKIADLVGGMGHDAFSLAYPDLYRLMEDSPIILQSRIAQQELKNDYLVALRGPEPVPQEPAEGPAAPEVRADGSSYFELPGAVPPQTATEATEPASADEGEVSPAQAIADEDDEGEGSAGIDDGDELVLTDVQPVIDLEVRENISLREIYGLGSDRRAIIMHGQDRIMIEVGDELPGRTLIKSIDSSSIVIIRDDEETTIKLNG